MSATDTESIFKYEVKFKDALSDPMRTPKQAPPLGGLLSEELKADANVFMRQSEPAVRELVEKANNEAWNWEDCGHRAHQVGLTARQFWVLVKMARMSDRRPIPLTDKVGRAFTYRLPPAAHRILHLIDTNLGGTIGSAFPQIGSENDQKRYLLTSLREEAIASSQIEGAVATREQAKEMLRASRRPRTQGERMIWNNYRTIQMLNQRRQERLTPALLCEVQQTLTEDTLEDPGCGGRFRRADENIAVWDEEAGEPLHVPPTAETLPERVARLCEFANADTKAARANASNLP